jgi:hypothetical protein
MMLVCLVTSKLVFPVDLRWISYTCIFQEIIDYYDGDRQIIYNEKCLRIKYKNYTDRLPHF